MGPCGVRSGFPAPTRRYPSAVAYTRAHSRTFAHPRTHSHTLAHTRALAHTRTRSLVRLFASFKRRFRVTVSRPVALLKGVFVSRCPVPSPSTTTTTSVRFFSLTTLSFLFRSNLVPRSAERARGFCVPLAADAVCPVAQGLWARRLQLWFFLVHRHSVKKKRDSSFCCI